MTFCRLVECQVRHEYEGDAACDWVSVSPTGQCVDAMASAGLIFKRTRRGFFIAAATGAEERPRVKGLRLFFKVDVTDADFFTYTDMGKRPDKRGVYKLSNMGAGVRHNRLQQGVTVGKTDWHEFESDMFAPYYGGAELLRDGPLGVIELSMEEALSTAAGAAFKPKVYTLEFAARQAVWRYHVRAAKLPKVPVAVIKGPCDFEPENAELKADKIQVFTSKKKIRLSRQYIRGIQLAEARTQADGSKSFTTIIGNLPNPTASSFSKGGAADIHICI